MNVLVVVGTCLRQNSSANLCHISYINGLLELGHNVDLVTVDEKDYPVDSSITIPDVDNLYTYYGLSLYEKLSAKKKNTVFDDNTDNKNTSNQSKKIRLRSILSFMVNKLKKIWWYSYGPYCTNKVWSNRASNFKSDKLYDYVISIAYPAASHRTVKRLICKNNIKHKKWIQIWEDPWSTDLFYYNGKYKIIENAERKIVRQSDKVVYVSPITLQIQKRLFPDSAEKMAWFPLPSYYSSVNYDMDLSEHKTYGYFGDYVSHIRNLEPFYNSAVKTGLALNICGNSDMDFKSNDNIHIYPRLSLDKLKPIEDQTNVLVFLCNLHGGQIPGKIYQYSATNKIILFILDGTEEEKRIIKDYFKQYNRFIFCDNDEASICNALEKIENNNFDEINNEPLDCFQAKDIMQKILESVEN